MNPTATVRSSVVIEDDCPITYQVTCGAQVGISCGSPNSMLELVFHPVALRELLKQGTEALAEVEARYAAIRAKAELAVAAE